MPPRPTKPPAPRTIKVTVGIDEAGRGPALGPMVMAVVALDTRAAATLSRAGLTDSKSYGSDDDARARRSELATRVRACAAFVAVEEVSVDEIDRRVAKVRRDQRWDEIRSRYTDEFGEILGGGYVNDGTRRFMRAYAERYRALPPEARRSWPHPYVHDIIGDQRPPGPQMSLL